MKNLPLPQLPAWESLVEPVEFLGMTYTPQTHTLCTQEGRERTLHTADEHLLRLLLPNIGRLLAVPELIQIWGNSWTNMRGRLAAAMKFLMGQDILTNPCFGYIRLGGPHWRHILRYDPTNLILDLEALNLKRRNKVIQLTPTQAMLMQDLMTPHNNRYPLLPAPLGNAAASSSGNSVASNINLMMGAPSIIHVRHVRGQICLTLHDSRAISLPPMPPKLRMKETITS